MVLAVFSQPQVSSHELDVRRDPFAGMGMWPFGNPFLGAQSMFSEMVRSPVITKVDFPRECS